MRKKMNTHSKFAKASITVEACMVVPVVLLVIFSLLSLCFYTHNRAWYTAAAGEIAVTVSTVVVNRDADISSSINLKVAALDGLCSFPDRSKGINIVYNDPKVEVTAESEVLFFMSRDRFSFHVQESMKVIRPVKFIRTVQAAEIMVEGL